MKNNFLLVILSSLLCSTPENIKYTSISTVKVDIINEAMDTSTYRIIITCPDLQTTESEDYSSGQTIELYIPEGTNRIFHFERYDSNFELTDTGTTISDINPGMNNIVVNLKALIRIAATDSGFQYYKFIIDEMSIGGISANGAKISETHFVLKDVIYPMLNNYSILSSTQSEAGDPNTLFDGKGHPPSSYVTINKDNDLPYEWVIDTKNNYFFEKFFILCIEPEYYKVPSSIRILCSHFEKGPWILIATKEYYSGYTSDFIPLTYP